MCTSRLSARKTRLGQAGLDVYLRTGQTLYHSLTLSLVVFPCGQDMCIEVQFDGPRQWSAWSFDEGRDVNALESPRLLGTVETIHNASNRGGYLHVYRGIV